jgi:hypothetical protein
LIILLIQGGLVFEHRQKFIDSVVNCTGVVLLREVIFGLLDGIDPMRSIIVERVARRVPSGVVVWLLEIRGPLCLLISLLPL